MRAPWIGKTGLAKATAILGTVLLVSLGLCGGSFAVGTSLYAGRWDLGHTLNSAIVQVLFWGAWPEAAGIVVGTAGLMVVAVIAVSRALRRGNSNGERGTES